MKRETHVGVVRSKHVESDLVLRRDRSWIRGCHSDGEVVRPSEVRSDGWRRGSTSEQDLSLAGVVLVDWADVRRLLAMREHVRDRAGDDARRLIARTRKRQTKGSAPRRSRPKLLARVEGRVDSRYARGRPSDGRERRRWLSSMRRGSGHQTHAKA
jgi:hypothetical protein